MVPHSAETVRAALRVYSWSKRRASRCCVEPGHAARPALPHGERGGRRVRLRRPMQRRAAPRRQLQSSAHDERALADLLPSCRRQRKNKRCGERSVPRKWVPDCVVHDPRRPAGVRSAPVRAPEPASSHACIGIEPRQKKRPEPRSARAREKRIGRQSEITTFWTNRHQVRASRYRGVGFHDRYAAKLAQRKQPGDYGLDSAGRLR